MLRKNEKRLKGIRCSFTSEVCCLILLESITSTVIAQLICTFLATCQVATGSRQVFWCT